MSLVFPIHLDDAVIFSAPSPRTRRTLIQAEDMGRDFWFLSETNERIKVNGRDSSGANGTRGVRLTNLCGVRAGELQKQCPNCDRRRPLSEYGQREMTHTGEQRDQSHCMRCRQQSGR